MNQQLGLVLLTGVVSGLISGICLLDLWFEAHRRPPLGRLIATWSRRYPLYSAGLVMVFGAMLGHFFWP